MTTRTAIRAMEERRRPSKALQHGDSRFGVQELRQVIVKRDDGWGTGGRW